MPSMEQPPTTTIEKNERDRSAEVKKLLELINKLEGKSREAWGEILTFLAETFEISVEDVHRLQKEVFLEADEETTRQLANYEDWDDKKYFGDGK